ncbi:MAG: PD-(D/E)XK nuclease family protein [bacterium]|nr:PD-(D/E)XK nuclease family protein [bacterium]
MDEPSWAGTLRISKSQIQAYLQCSQRFQYQYVLAVPWEAMPVSLLFGRALHKAVALYDTRKQADVDVTLDELDKLFCRTWEEDKKGLPLLLSRGADEKTMLAQGRELLQCFMDEVKPRIIAAVEEPFTVDLVDVDTGEVLPVKLVGIIDLLESDGQGNFIVAELKTATRKYTESQGEHHMDGAVYGYAMQQLGYTTTPKQVLVRFDVLVKTKTPQFEQYYFNKSEPDFRKFLRLATRILRAIDREVFVPNEGWYCTTCPFRGRCMQEQSR